MGRGGERRGGRAGGAATLSSHPPKPCTLAARLTSVTTTTTRCSGGICSLSALAATCRSLSPGPPAASLGRGLARRALGVAGPSPPERWAPGPPLSSAPARSAPRNSRPANFKGPPGTSKRAGRPATAASALTIDPHERSAARLRRRPGQGPGPRLGSQRQPWAPPGRSRRRGTWGVARQGRGGEGKQSRIRARSTGEGGGSGAPHRPFYAKDPSGPPPPPRPPPAPPAPARPGFQHRSCFQQSLRAPNVLRALPTKTALWI